MRVTAGSVITGRGILTKGQIIEADDALANEMINNNAAVEAKRVKGHKRLGDQNRIGYWHTTNEWQDKTACIIGGGPSLTKDDVGKCAGKYVIAVNNAIHLAPWADILYFSDVRWYHWHRSAVHAFQGRRVTMGHLPLQAELELYSLRDYGVNGMPQFDDGITNGRNSGFQAMQVAALLGATRILLLGFDMQARGDRMHWHEEHPIATPSNVFREMIECFKRVSPELTKRGIEVINCSPGSALKVFRQMSIDEALRL